MPCRPVVSIAIGILSFSLVLAQGQTRPVTEHTFQIRDHNGAPTFFLDGRPEFPMLLFQCVLTEREPAILRSAGVRLYSFNGNTNAFGMSLGWIGENQFDYTECDTALRAFAERVPDGYCIPRVLLHAPVWWLDRHPEESVQFATGVGWQDNGWGGTKHESFASRLWQHETGEVLRRFVRHILNSPYGGRVAGIHLAGGVYGEWHAWSPTDLPDTSEPMRHAFARYVVRKYDGDVERLRRTWGDPEAAFATIRIPSREQQDHGDVGMFRDPARSQALIDYAECLHGESWNAIESFCRIVKEESRGRLLTMVLYGYTPDLPWSQVGDHRAAATAFRSDFVDIFASPHSYHRRRPGEDGMFRHFPASLALHGKLFLDEGDDRTHLAPKEWPARYANNVEESISVLRREFANAVTRGVGLYYMDQSGMFFSDPAYLDELGRLKKWGDRSMELPRESVAQVAVISSLESEFYTCGRHTGRNPISLPLYNEQVVEFCRAGAPFDWYTIEDLPDPKMKSYCLYIFLDCFHLTPSQRDAVARLKKNRQTLLWYYAPGFVTDDVLSKGSMESLTGLRFDQSERGTLCLKMETSIGTDVPAEFGAAVEVSPYFLPKDSDVEVLARQSGTAHAVLVRKTFDGWTSIYNPGTVLPAALLRSLYRDAGVHVYCDSGDHFSANAGWLSLHTVTAGCKTVRLPTRSDVYDIFAEKNVLKNGCEFGVDVTSRSTYVFLVTRPQ